MARKTIPATCYKCGGAKVIYQSALGDHTRGDFRIVELLQAREAKLITEVQCPVCKGRGAVDLLVRS